jgi:hypothetical protein
MLTRSASRQASASTQQLTVQNQRLVRERAARSEARKSSWEDPRRPERGEEECRLSLQPVDDAILPDDDLADINATEFGDNAAGQREVLETLRRVEQSLRDEAAVSGRVPLNELPDRPQITNGLIRPANHTHPKMRFRASSWLTVSPASAWRRPSSILARK